MAINRIGRLRERRIPAELRLFKSAEAFETLKESESTRYLIGSMQPIDPTYTKNTFKEAERIQDQLNVRLPFRPEYEYQGSVTNDTHIKAHSDIDLLVLHTYFTTMEPPQTVSSPYPGDPLKDLIELRKNCTSSLTVAFPAATIDVSGARSISLSGGSLQRKVDVVVANWWDTVDFAQYKAAFFRGIMVLDIKIPSRVKNRPFWHNKLIDMKDVKVGGSLRKAIRLLKSLKYDADSEVRISSYDIAAIVYSIPETSLSISREQDLLLAQNVLNYLEFLLANEAARTSLTVPNGMRPIFGGEGATRDGLVDLHRELKSLLVDVQLDLSRSFRKLAEARIPY